MIEREPNDRPTTSPEAKKANLALKGSRSLLRTAWIALLLWIIMLAALALHVLEVW